MSGGDQIEVLSEVRTLGDLAELVNQWMQIQPANTPLRPYVGERRAEFGDGVMWAVHMGDDNEIGLFVSPVTERAGA